MTGVFDPYREWLGIDPQEHPVDHYRLLGLQRFESDVALIHQAADACMVEVRLHQLGPHGRHTQKLLNEISTARVCLVHPGSRQTYDSQLADDVAPTVKPLGMSPPPAPPSVPPVPPPAPVMTGHQRPRKAAATDADVIDFFSRLPHCEKQIVSIEGMAHNTQLDINRGRF